MCCTIVTCLWLIVYGVRSESVMVSYQIPAIDTFNFNKPSEWPSWIRRFEHFRQASGLSAKSEEEYCEQNDGPLQPTNQVLSGRLGVKYISKYLSTSTSTTPYLKGVLKYNTSTFYST